MELLLFANLRKELDQVFFLLLFTLRLNLFLHHSLFRLAAVQLQDHLVSFRLSLDKMVTVNANGFKFLSDIVVNLWFKVVLVEVLEHFLLGIDWHYVV